MTARRIIALATALAALAVPAAASAKPHTWVDAVGDDVNPCSRTAPCKTLAGTLAKTDAGGFVSVLGSANLAPPATLAGPTVISHSVTIDAQKDLADMATVSGGGLVVAAGATDTVIIRNVQVRSLSPCSAAGTTDGIAFTGGAALRLENVTVSGFSGAGLRAAPDPAATLTVDHSDFHDNCTAGVSVAETAHASVNDSALFGNGSAIKAGPGATVEIGRDTITGNTVGLDTTGGGTIVSSNDNHIDNAPLLPAPPPAPTPTTPAPVVVPGPVINEPLPSCVVPTLKGKTLGQVRSAIAKTICHLGTVTYKVTSKHKRNRASSQKPSSGSPQLAGAVIDVTINGRAPKHRTSHVKAKAALAPRAVTYVSGVGDDVNPCSVSAPCQTLAGALSQTASGGVVIVEDSGDFGDFTVTSPVTIEGSPSALTSVNVDVALPSAVLIAAGAGADVTLRHVTIQRLTPCAAPGTDNGIDVRSAGSVHLDHVVVTGFSGTGVLLDNTVNTALTMRDSTLSNNCTSGITAQPSGALTSALSLDSTLTDDGSAVIAGAGSVVRLAGTEIDNASTALTETGGGQILLWPDNDIGGNAADGLPTGALGRQ
jgi:Right handed beta helix region